MNVPVDIHQEVLDIAKLALEQTRQGVVLVFGALGACITILTFLGWNAFRRAKLLHLEAKARLDKMDKDAAIALAKLDSMSLNLSVAFDLSLVKSYQAMSDYHAARDVCSRLLENPKVDSRQRALALGIRGWAHKRLSMVSDALADIEQCLVAIDKAEADNPVTSRTMRASALFNAACYCSLSRKWNPGFKYLSKLFESMDGDTTAMWSADSWQDPDLEPMRAHDRDRFIQVVGAQ